MNSIHSMSAEMYCIVYTSCLNNQWVDSLVHVSSSFQASYIPFFLLYVVRLFFLNTITLAVFVCSVTVALTRTTSELKN